MIVSDQVAASCLDQDLQDGLIIRIMDQDLQDDGITRITVYRILQML